MICLLILWLWDRLDWNKNTGQTLKYYLWQLLVIVILVVIAGKN